MSSGGVFGVIGGLFSAIAGLINTAIPIVFAAAFLGFFYGLAKYVFSAGNEEAKEQGKMIMIWGTIALFVMLSVFGIIRLFQGTLLNGTSTGAIAPPTVRVGGGGFQNSGYVPPSCPTGRYSSSGFCIYN